MFATRSMQKFDHEGIRTSNLRAENATALIIETIHAT
jgi:hypothetical protein